MSVNPDRVPPDPSADKGGPETAVRAAGEAETGRVERTARHGFVAAIKSDGEDEAALRSRLDPPATLRSREEASEAHDLDRWAEEAEQAVARACAVGTSAAWRQAAEAAIVVSEMAQTMQVAADAKQTAEQKTKTAQDAAQAAQVASQAAADAKRSAEQKAKTAQDAAQAAQVASQAAADAKRSAEQETQAAPIAAQAAEVASQIAADAKRTAHELESIVAKARAANAPAAWSEALRLAEAVWAKESNETASPTSTGLDRPARPIMASAWSSGGPTL